MTPQFDDLVREPNGGDYAQADMLLMTIWHDGALDGDARHKIAEALAGARSCGAPQPCEGDESVDSVASEVHDYLRNEVRGPGKPFSVHDVDVACRVMACFILADRQRVRAAEREACAKVCDDQAGHYDSLRDQCLAEAKAATTDVDESSSLRSADYYESQAAPCANLARELRTRGRREEAAKFCLNCGSEDPQIRLRVPFGDPVCCDVFHHQRVESGGGRRVLIGSDKPSMGDALDAIEGAREESGAFMSDELRRHREQIRKARKRGEEERIDRISKDWGGTLKELAGGPDESGGGAVWPAKDRARGADCEDASPQSSGVPPSPSSCPSCGSDDPAERRLERPTEGFQFMPKCRNDTFHDRSE